MVAYYSRFYSLIVGFVPGRILLCAPVKKTRLDVEYSFDFALWGLVSPLKDHKLAWVINCILDVEMSRQNEHSIELRNGGMLGIGNYLFEDEFIELRLLKNRAVQLNNSEIQWLAPELSNFDFFLLDAGVNKPLESPETLNQIKQHNSIDYIVQIDVSDLKSKDNFVF